jgi:solute:Na+ symporter, SSS family
MRSSVDVGALVAFVVVLLAVPVIGLLVGRRQAGAARFPAGPGGSPAGTPYAAAPGQGLAEWALAGRRYGAWRTWFLLGGSIFTAYTFVAVPALVYGVGALGFFAVPYAIVVFQLAYLLLPWLRDLAAAHGWVTPADIVRSRYSSPSLAAAVAVTGLLATMPYIALQLLGIGALLTVLGLPENGVLADLALSATFAVLAVGTYRHGVRTPAAIAVLKGVLVFGAVALVSMVTLRTTGSGALFGRAGDALAGRPQGSLLLTDGLAGPYVTLAVGSALALMLYPHVLVPAFAARSADVLRRNAIGLLAWTALLAALAVLGLVALGQGVRVPSGRAELAVPVLVHDSLPPVLAGIALGAIGIGALVPAAVMSIGAASTFASNIYLEYVNPTALPGQVTQVAKIVSVVVKVGALAFVFGLRSQDAITLQLLGGVWILQTLPAVVIGLRWRWPHRYALLAGLMFGVTIGTVLVAAQGFVAVTRIDVGGLHVGVYAGLVALTANLLVAILLTPVLDRAAVPRGVDGTGVGGSARSRQEWEVGG